MRRPVRVAILTAGALVALTSGCSGGSGGGDAFAEPVAANLRQQLGVDREASDCMAEAFVDEVGDEPFEAAGLEPEDLRAEASVASQLGRNAIDAGQARAIVQDWGSCTDLPAAYARRISSDYQLDGAEVACLGTALQVERAVLDDYLRRSLVTDRVEELDDPLTAIVVLVQACTEEGGRGGFIVESIAASLARDGQLTADQALCVAQALVDRFGAADLIERTGVGDFETAPPEEQDAFAQGIIDATTACGIPAAPAPQAGPPAG